MIDRNIIFYATKVFQIELFPSILFLIIILLTIIAHPTSSG
jgi:hypothetical protein